MKTNTSIMNKYFSSCEYMEDFYEKCRAASGVEFTTVSGKKYKMVFSQKYGDPRYYFLPINANENALFNYSFISECEIAKFVQCFPALKPHSKIELLNAYSISEPCGPMLPSKLIPEYNAKFIELLYAFFNAVSWV